MNNSKHRLLACVLALGLGASSLGQAAERDSYMGFTLGSASPDNGAYDNSMGWRLFGGHRVNPYFAIEGAYMSLGKMDGPMAENPLYGMTSLSTTGFEFSAIGSYPFASRFAVYGKLGLLIWDTANANAGPTGGTVTTGDSNLFYGLGGRFDLSDTLGFLASWDRYPVDNEVDSLSLGIYFRF